MKRFCSVVFIVIVVCSRQKASEESGDINFSSNSSNTKYQKGSDSSPIPAQKDLDLSDVSSLRTPTTITEVEETPPETLCEARMSFVLPVPSQRLTYFSDMPCDAYDVGPKLTSSVSEVFSAPPIAKDATQRGRSKSSGRLEQAREKKEHQIETAVNAVIEANLIS